MKARKGNGGRQLQARKAGKASSAQAQTGGNQTEMSQYIFTFELLRQYPNVRTYMLKQPLQKSFKDQVSELLGGKKR